LSLPLGFIPSATRIKTKIQNVCCNIPLHAKFKGTLVKYLNTRKLQVPISFPPLENWQ
jgi:hypothetical protein